MKIEKISFQNSAGSMKKADLEKNKKKQIQKAVFITFGLIAGTLGAYYLIKHADKCNKIKDNLKTSLDSVNNNNTSTKKTRAGDSYRESLALSLSEILGIKIEPDNISGVLNKEEFLNEIQKLSKENYNPKNAQSGLFRADLHSHSIYSDGEIEVSELMDELSKYSKNLYNKTGHKFLFALTDHDGIKGVKEALKIIAKNPEKFKYLNFVTGSEISYVHKSTATNNPCETSELLAYCFNPFSNKINGFFDGIMKKREQFSKNYINELNKNIPDTKFDFDEFKKIYNPNESMLMNIHWKNYHYGQTKKAITDVARAKGKNPEKFYEEIMRETGYKKYLDTLKKMGVVSNYIKEDNRIVEINNKLRPDYINNKITTQSENTLGDIFSAFSDDKETIMGFAHPYYMTERLYDVQTFAKDVIGQSRGLIKLSESYHQAYGDNISLKKIDEINTILEKNILIPIGGLDNHKPVWLKV